MSLAVRAVSVKRGIDPRDTTMIAFGGAGPLHAVAIAREISIPKVIIPKLPGAFSALGMLMAEWRQDFVRTLIGELGKVDRGDGRSGLCRTARRRRKGARARSACATAQFGFAADLRYRGQEHTIADRGRGRRRADADTDGTRARFHAQHDRATATPRPISRSKSSTCASSSPCRACRTRSAAGWPSRGSRKARRPSSAVPWCSTTPTRPVETRDPVAAASRRRHRDRRSGRDRGAEFDHADRARRSGGRSTPLAISSSRSEQASAEA